MKILCLVVIFAALACSSCGPGVGFAKMVPVTATFLTGASPNSPASMLMAENTRSGPISRVIASAGNWNVTPNKLILTATGMSLGSSGSNNQVQVPLAGCTVAWNLAQVGLSKMLDCPFTIPAGTYDFASVSFSSTYQVLINDATNQIYTDPTSPSLLTVGTAPAGGAQLVTVTTTSSGSTFGNQFYFNTPLVVSDSSPQKLSIVVNGLQFLKLNVSGSTASFGWPNTNYANDPFRPDLALSLSAPAQVEFYSNTGINTALSYNTNTAGVTGVAAVAVYYSSATTATMLNTVLNGNPTNCGPFGVSLVINGPPVSGASQLGGYLGLDGAGTLGWAVPMDTSFQSYSAELSMTRKTTLAQTTTLKCKKISSDPAPSGGSFSSGAPNITTPDYTASFALVAR